VCVCVCVCVCGAGKAKGIMRKKSISMKTYSHELLFPAARRYLALMAVKFEGLVFSV
jgi:hypothetical protein